MKLNYLTLTLIAFFSLTLISFKSVDPGVLQTQDESVRTATFLADTKFDTNADGFVLVKFDISNKLQTEEQAELDEFTTENAERISVEFDDLTVTVKLIGDLNNSNAWSKVFYIMGITQYTFGSNADQIKQPFDVFSNHFNL